MSLNKYTELVNQHLVQKTKTLSDSKVKEALMYSLLDGGKRLRPCLLLSLLDDLGIDPQLGLDAACALECIHTYSLIHDDLPALDNDDMRRYKPTNHKVYGEDIAILAGDGLLTLAFQFASSCGGECVDILAQQAGVNGMILGQEIDLADEIPSLDVLLRCYELKTGCLFHGALEMAVVLANRNDLRDFAKILGRNLGIAFQVQDDCLEATEDSSTIGKSNTSDADRNKTTILTYLSLPEALTMCDQVFTAIGDACKHYGLDKGHLMEIIQIIDKRNT